MHEHNMQGGNTSGTAINVAHGLVPRLIICPKYCCGAGAMTRLSASLFVLSASHPVPCLCAPKHKKTPRRCSPTKKVEFLPSCLLCFEAGSLLPKVHFTQAHAANPLNPKQNRRRRRSALQLNFSWSLKRKSLKSLCISRTSTIFISRNSLATAPARSTRYRTPDRSSRLQ